MSEFARKQLEKYGWSEGQGLGKDENGITNPIKAKLKFDNQGIGHNNVKQWTSAWWCDMFNDASKRISVTNTEAGVHFSSEKTVVENTSPSVFLIHKNFVKAGTTEGSTELPCRKRVTQNNSTSVMSDSLFRMCEGTKKTCFNYSLMKGKIKRVRKQEAIFEQNYGAKEKSIFKKKKRKNKKKVSPN